MFSFLFFIFYYLKNFLKFLDYFFSGLSYMTKLEELSRYSDPEEVNRLAMKLHLNPVYESSRARSKYMVFDGNKMVHFGSFSPKYEDYTKHGDKKRRDNFRKRNHRWANAPRYSPAWLSYYLLW